MTMHRPLGLGEQTYWLSDRWATRHFALSAQIAGRIDPRRIAAGLLAAQARHPAFRVAIRQNSRGEPVMVTDDSCPVPLRLVEYAGDDRSFNAAIAAELTQPFDATNAPLLRCLLLASDNVSELILVINHAIGDGLSAATLACEILGYPAGSQAKPARAPRPSLEDLVGIQTPAIASTFPAQYPLRDPRNQRWIAPAFLEPTELATLHRRCVTEGTTVHSALCVAFTLAILPETSFDAAARCLCPINMRGHCAGLDADFGLFLSFAVSPYLYRQTSFWDQARRLREHLVRARNPALLSDRTAFFFATPPPPAFGTRRSLQYAASPRRQSAGRLEPRPHRLPLWRDGPAGKFDATLS